jgi:hypothetical protein
MKHQAKPANFQLAIVYNITTKNQEESLEKKEPV